MTLEGLKTALEGMHDNAFKDKVAYRAFPADDAPDLPFICILEKETDNFTADSKVYLKRTNVDIELYTKQKDTTTEGYIESMLGVNEIIWDKYEEFIESEEVLEVVYGVVI